MKRQLITLNNETISYLADDQIKDLVVLFIHGFGDSSKRVLSLFNINNRNYSLVAIDLPGCGLSSNNNDISIEYYCEIVSQFISQILPNKKIYLLSHSLGILPALYNSKIHSNIKHIFGITPLLPLDLDDSEIKEIKGYLLPNDSNEFYISQLQLFSDSENDWILKDETKQIILKTSLEFLQKRKKMFSYIVNQIFNSNIVKEMFDSFYATNDNLSIVISANDKFINYKKALNVIKHYHIEYTELNSYGHAMFYNGTKDINKIIEEYIKEVK
ncbi:alpha/beta hydrolase [Metamycoplasma auris]|uniref:Pimeloyl-ACP methyl ester carboxylesterase n=1 Tax=Metamycoplasma auris TaxID=51363 RepID=A0A2W7FVL1_9BACT|nr:alpha/beta hydrolase [Metamycoplasma auris]PZV97713.1 pimeloyl-ACP methyl ester carboxylesterase [Metamycoplasma auris]